MDLDASTPDVAGAAIVDEIDRLTGHAPVDTDVADRAAAPPVAEQL
jgi:hypothetical protein